MATHAAVTGLDGEVVVLRDEWGIPHVRSTTMRDAFFAQGYVQAEDRSGQLEYDRRRAHGRWAEVAGASAVAFDVFTRRCGLAAAARREYDALPDEAQIVLEAFAEGVNACWAGGCPPALDLELAGITPEPWQPWYSCAVFVVRHVVFANWQKKLWRGRLAVLLGADALARVEGADARPVPLILPPDAWWLPEPADPAGVDAVPAATASCVEVAPGSNAWALAGGRTASGLPIVAGDPHRLLEVPNVYVQGHVACDEFDVAGLSFVGVPGFPHFGQSERVAWAVTNAFGDYQDLYVERFAPGDPTRYEFAGEWREASIRREVVDVRDADPVEVECIDTHHGPVLFGDPRSGYAISMASTALAEPSRGLATIAPMMRARTVGELDDVMRDWVDPVNNFVSADADGAIAYRTVGRIPVRDRAVAWGPVPGWTGEFEWDGYIPYDDMPHERDPANGEIVTANQRIVGPSYPHHLSDGYSRPDRAARIRIWLDALGPATPDAMAAIHRDVHTVAADVWIERFTALVPFDDAEAEALRLLREWDRELATESCGATVYMVLRDTVGCLVAGGDHLAPLRQPFPGEPVGSFQPLAQRLWPILPGLLRADDAVLLAPGTTWDDVVVAGLREGVERLRSLLGDDPAEWQWGRLHLNAPVHPLSAARPGDGDAVSAPAVALGGEADTVFSSAHPAGVGFNATNGSVARYVFDLADRGASRWIVPLGAAGDPRSPHFADQRDRWAAGELVSMQTDWDVLQATAESRSTLDPG